MAVGLIARNMQSGGNIPVGVHDASLPLVVDLEGTCVKTNLFLEYLLALLKKNPLYLFALPIWLLKGRIYLTRQVIRRASLDCGLLPYRKDFLEFLKEQRAQGRSIILSPTSDSGIVRQVASYLMLFDLIPLQDVADASNRDRSVSGLARKSFDYATSGRSEKELLSSARNVILVHPSHHAKVSIPKLVRVERLFDDRQPRVADYFAPLRPQHWLKNLLVFVPVFAAHRFLDGHLLLESLVAFVALCCCASSGYVFNDLFDLAADRRHPRKKFRSFAAGDLALTYALIMIPSLVGVACILGALLSRPLLAMLLTYYVLTLTYTLYIKKIVLFDVIVLAGLYTVRIMVGSTAVDIWPSPWLLTFSMFFFLSLALVKRYSELVMMRKTEGENAKARGYETGDEELLAAKGTASGYLAVFVLAFYIVSGSADNMYRRHQFMWLLCPLLLYWLGRIWLMAHRGRMNDDPVVFATTDWTSRILILLMLGIAALSL